MTRPSLDTTLAAVAAATAKLAARGPILPPGLGPRLRKLAGVVEGLGPADLTYADVRAGLSTGNPALTGGPGDALRKLAAELAQPALCRDVAAAAHGLCLLHEETR